MSNRLEPKVNSAAPVWERCTFLDVVVSKSSTIFKLLSGEDQSLLIRWNSYQMTPLPKLFNAKDCHLFFPIKRNKKHHHQPPTINSKNNDKIRMLKPMTEKRGKANMRAL